MRYFLAALAALSLALSPSGFFDGPRGDSAEAAALAGTDIFLTDQTFVCDQAISSYGELPITVHQTWTQNNVVEFGVRLQTGCVGEGNTGPPQLIFEIGTMAGVPTWLCLSGNVEHGDFAVGAGTMQQVNGRPQCFGASSEPAGDLHGPGGRRRASAERHLHSCR